jgi:hypothetical protein
MSIAALRSEQLAEHIRWFLANRCGNARRASKSEVLQNIRGRYADRDLPSGVRWKLGAYFINMELDDLVQEHGITVEKIYKGVCLDRTYYAV